MVERQLETIPPLLNWPMWLVIICRRIGHCQCCGRRILHTANASRNYRPHLTITRGQRHQTSKMPRNVGELFSQNGTCEASLSSDVTAWSRGAKLRIYLLNAIPWRRHGKCFHVKPLISPSPKIAPFTDFIWTLLPNRFNWWIIHWIIHFNCSDRASGTGRARAWSRFWL